MGKSMLATLLISLAAVVAALKLLDLLMSDAQKAWLSNVVITAWNRVDEARGWSFSDWLLNPKARGWYIVAVAFNFLFLNFYPLLVDYVKEMAIERDMRIWLEKRYDTFQDLVPEGTDLAEFVMKQEEWRTYMSNLLDSITEFDDLMRLMMFCAFLALFWFIPLFLSRALNGLSGRVVWLRILALVVGCLVVGGIWLLAVSYIPIGGDPDQWGNLLRWSTFVFTIPATLCIGFIVLIFTAMAFVYLAALLLGLAEFFIRRIAEYPKGPVLALSALLGGLVALTKVFVE
jgi:hypothetical protein